MSEKNLKKKIPSHFTPCTSMYSPTALGPCAVGEVGLVHWCSAGR